MGPHFLCPMCNSTPELSQGPKGEWSFDEYFSLNNLEVATFPV
jgi:hypothetical protein